jgi:2-C-methyl-D-erythritol 4-phosphate cytidylyltransferase/2-C-methyl-D-erythritol 2,4-cyclodiphosphate synthase
MARGHADVVVVAAGTSQRFGSDKLEADVGGRPLLAWTLDRLASSELVEGIVVVTSADRLDRIRSAAWLPSKVADVIAGGARRQDSVAAGLGAVAERATGGSDDAGDRVVLIHDGARPLITPALIESVILAVREFGAAVPVVPIAETVKRVDRHGRIVDTLDRTELAAAQTPQGATLGTFQRAFREQSGHESREFTDEAALLEACRIAVHAIPGDERNFKVTLPGDLARVAAILTDGLPGARSADAWSVAGRTGFGSDSHPFGPGKGLALGGLLIEAAPALNGHSDGDVLLHAIADALLGAAGLGDLGRIFPAGPDTPSGVASAELLGEVVRRVTGAGYQVANLDCTIVGARPRLATRLPAIGNRIAELIGVEPAVVNVKASTGNLAGMEGAGRGISAVAVVMLREVAAVR